MDEKSDEKRKKTGEAKAACEKRYRKRKHPVQVYFSNRDYEKMSKRAKDAGLTISEFVRRAVSGKEIVVIDCGHELVYELTRLACALDRASKRLSEEPCGAEALEAVKEDCVKALNEVHGRFAGHADT